MKQLLYIPTGKYVLFYCFVYENDKNLINPLCWSIEQYSNWRMSGKHPLTIEQCITELLLYLFTEDIYNAAGIPYGDGKNLDRSSFELVDV